ncbi:tetratricopeptide repeat protein [Ensifer sp. ENS02]|uniref:tetratricopeptide repeat protein n=1 Tax=Ensifer sp. ENS02 TaxID=2769290 RepID=UPI00177B7E85|nr:tetratricopeptide repeat protein [Ensifer sp. ENS02]
MALPGCATTDLKDTPKATSAETKLMSLADDVYRRGDATTALALYERAATLAPTDAATQVKLAQARTKANDVKGAEAAYRHALELAPDNAQASLGLGGVQLRSGDAEGAAKTLAAVAPILKSARAYNNLGTAYVLQGRTAEAEAAFREALVVQPGNLDSQTNLALAQASAGKLPEASALMEEVVRSPAVKSRHLVNAMIVMVLAGRQDQARALNITDMEPQARDGIMRQATQVAKLQDPSKRAKAIGVLASG